MNKVLCHFILIFSLLCQHGKLYAIDSVYVFKEAQIKLNIPNAHWHMQPRQEKNGYVIYLLKRDPIVDSLNRNIIPNAAVIIEKINAKTDIVTYSVNKRAKGFIDIAKMFTHDDGEINYVNAIGYEGTYIDKNSLSHTVYVIHAINGDMGVQIILDTTTETFPSIEAEFIAILKSIRN